MGRFKNLTEIKVPFPQTRDYLQKEKKKPLCLDIFSSISGRDIFQGALSDQTAFEITLLDTAPKPQLLWAAFDPPNVVTAFQSVSNRQPKILP